MSDQQQPYEGYRPQEPSGDPQPESPQPGQPPQGQTPQGYPQPGYPVYPQYSPDPPGRTLGIVGFVLAFVFAPAGIAVSAVALSESKKAGYDNALGKWGLWLSIAFTALIVLFFVLYIVFFVVMFGAMGFMVSDLPTEMSTQVSATVLPSI